MAVEILQVEFVTYYIEGIYFTTKLNSNPTMSLTLKPQYVVHIIQFHLYNFLFLVFKINNIFVLGFLKEISKKLDYFTSLRVFFKCKTISIPYILKAFQIKLNISR